MAVDTNNPYFRTKVMTASPEELRLMLLEGAVRFMHEGRTALVAKDWEGVYDGFSQAKAIVMELINALRPEVAPELCSSLSALYTYIYRLLTEGSFERDLAKIDEAIRLMDYERETWAMAMEKLAREKGALGSAPAPGSDEPATDRPRLAVQG